MEGEFRLLTADEMAQVYHQHMKFDFPPDELKPLKRLQTMLESGNYAPYALLREGEVVAYAFYWTAGDSYAMLDYFAVVRSHRNQGVGGELLQEMLARFCVDGRGVFGEVEMPISGDPEVDALRNRRLNFYLRNGMRWAGFYTKVFGVPYVMICCGPDIAPEELMEVDRRIYRSALSPAMYEKNIFIPWSPEVEP